MGQTPSPDTPIDRIRSEKAPTTGAFLKNINQKGRPAAVDLAAGKK
jgi:hypothetical protein